MSFVKKLRRAWAALGSVALVVFLLWMVLGYRASSTALAALVSDDRVTVTEQEGLWRFEPADSSARRRVGFLFFPGALVDARAYAPLLREIADGGYLAILLRVPWRGAFGSYDRPAVRGRARRVMQADATVAAWVAGGHSRGAKVASLLARDGAPRLGGLVLLGSTHPRDFSLARIDIPVVKVYGTRDGVAPSEDVLANRDLLPPSTEWVRIEGGNHAQFGWYGFQPLDHFADISRSEQQAQTVAAIRELLATVDRRLDTINGNR